MTMKHYTKLQISTTKYTVQPCCLVTAIINMIFWFCTELLSSVNKTLSVWHFNFGISQQQLLICMYVLCLMTYVLLCMNVFTIFFGGGVFHFLTIICISRVCVCVSVWSMETVLVFAFTWWIVFVNYDYVLIKKYC